jgi:hypothetical protein
LIGLSAVLKPGLNTAEPGQFLIPLPTPRIIDNSSVALVRVFLMFGTTKAGRIQTVNVMDGRDLVQAFRDLTRTGQYQTAPDAENTFVLTNPHTVNQGIAIYFEFNIGVVPFGGAEPEYVVNIASAGAEFQPAD